MSLSARNRCPQIRIEVTKLGRCLTCAKSCWNLKIRVQECSGTEVLRLIAEYEIEHFQDPLDQDDRTWLRRYLNKELDNGPLNDENRNFSKAQDMGLRQSQDLLKGLQLMKNEELRSISHRQVAIEVDIKTSLTSHRYGVPANPAKVTFQGLQWEGLEHDKVQADWSESFLGIQVRKVTVRRILVRRLPHESPNTTGMLSKTSTANKAYIDTLNILLVIARKGQNDQQGDDWPPMQTLTGLLKQQRRLRLEYGARHRIHLEVVRPGSLEALEAHLIARREATQDVNSFDIIHFDMHGGTSKPKGQAEGEHSGEKEAVLLFNDWIRNSLDTRSVSAAKIAKVLTQFNIKIVMLGACKSAETKNGLSANLAQNLVQAGIENVVAMSFRMAESMAEPFFQNFYDEFIRNKKGLAESASLARSALRKDPYRRRGLRGGKWELDDWYVPVVYSKGNDFRIQQEPKAWLMMMCSTVKWLSSEWFLADNILLRLCRTVVAVLFHAALSSLFLPTNSVFDDLRRQMGFVGHIPWSISVGVLWLALDWVYGLWRFLHFSKMIRRINNDKENILRVEGSLKMGGNRVIFYSCGEEEYRKATQMMTSLFRVWLRTNCIDKIIVQNCIRFKRHRYTWLPALQWLTDHVKWNLIHFYSLMVFLMEDKWCCRNQSHTRASQSSIVQPRKTIVLEDLHVLWPANVTEDELEAQGDLNQWIENLDRQGTDVYLLGGVIANTKEQVRTKLSVKVPALRNALFVDYKGGC